MLCMRFWETVVSANGFVQIWEFARFRVSAEMALQENRWFDASLKTFTLDVFWRTCCVILIFRCRCTVHAYPIVVLPCPIPGISRLLLCTACFLDFMPLLLGLRSSRFPSGGGWVPPPFSKFASLSMLEDTSVRSTLGSRTLSIMRQFVADVEKDYEEESGVGISELNVKGSHQVKDTRPDMRHATLNKEAIRHYGS